MVINTLEEITKNASLVNEFLSQKGLGAIRGGDAPPIGGPQYSNYCESTYVNRPHYPITPPQPGGEGRPAGPPR